METVVPIGPLAAGELSTLLAGEKDEGAVGEFGFIEESEEFADLGIHVGDLGEVVGVLLPRHRGVSEIRGEFDFLGWVGRGVAHYPRCVWFGESDDEAERLLRIARDKLLAAGEVVRIGGFRTHEGSNPGTFSKGKTDLGLT